MEYLNQLFNRLVDIAAVVATRLAELPFVFKMAVILVGVSGLFGMARMRRPRGGKRDSLGHLYVRALLVTSAIGAVMHIMQRTELQLRETRELKYYARQSALALNLAEMQASELRLIDRATTSRELQDVLGSMEFWATDLADGVEFASFHSQGPRPITGYVAVADLTQPGLEIAITDQFADKSLTSAFALDRGCVVAINGEAGTSPALDAELGSYVGHWIVKGAPILVANGHGRPYLGFDRKNLGTYFGSNVGDREPDEDVFNAFWGRGDLLLEGVYTPFDDPYWTKPNPRTLMGLDETGTRLILVVVDGRQRGYSVGVDLETAAKIIKAFGAHDAMWCDQGGSSTMFLGSQFGVVNRPSDERERATYTHFGISLP